ncbi:NifU homolog [Pelotomaculum thermopropionicum SI]|uniref:NifU homolog n=1 Tax=Pelotomaculum thermopropionicum (strain DSM 13744 / JCM 10971 / SI) TaxID=370438 RepID=A5D4Q3_PELTS|nr:NifU homolog [Pelotomaculum thermopropionicum SI]
MEEKVEKQYILDMIGKYSDTVIDHARNPRNVGNIPNCDGFSQETGECGDTMAIWLKVIDNKINNATFWTDGCGTTIACGSMVTEMAKNLSVEEALKIKAEDILNALGGLPEDHAHCAALAAEALRNAVKDYIDTSKFPWKKAYQKKNSTA